VDRVFSYPHSALVSDEKSIRGSYMGSCVPKRDIPRFIGLYQRGKLPVQKLRSGFIGFEDINAGFDLTTPLIFLPPRSCADSHRFPTRSGDFMDGCESCGWKRRNCAIVDG
jgi:hypothetical protein